MEKCFTPVSLVRAVWELMPLAAILGAGFGDFIKRHTLIGRKKGEVPAPIQSRPRIQVTGPKVKPLVCQICLGRVKEGTEYVKCSPGKVFHAVCLERVGSCPFCKKYSMVQGRESPATVNFDGLVPPIPSPPSGPEQRSDGDEGIECPVCGGRLDMGAASCPCGAVFIDDGGGFTCPDCGSRLMEGDAFCGKCGERFDLFQPRACPRCGKLVPNQSESCDCGVILADRCPECGEGLSPNYSVCSTCGATFEFLQE